MKPIPVCLLILSCGLGALGQDSLNVTRLSEVYLDAWIQGVALRDTFAYIGKYGHGLEIYNAADMRQPLAVGSLDYGGYPWHLVLNGPYVYVADEALGLRIIDISDPSNPTTASTVEFPYHTWDVKVVGDWAYVANGWSGLRTVNVSDPLAPYEVGWCDTPYEARGVDVAGNLACVADHNGDLRVIDIEDPALPTEIGSCTFAGLAEDVTIVGDLAYVAAYMGGLRIVDISDPTSPTEVGYYGAMSGANNVRVIQNLAYVTDDYFGLHVLDVTNPNSPLQVGYFASGAATTVALQGCIAFVADGFWARAYDISFFVHCGVPLAIDSLVVQPLQIPPVMRLSWAPVFVDTAVWPIVIRDYVVFRATNPEIGDWQDIGVPFPPDTTFFIDSVSFGQGSKFFYQVRAVGE